MPLGLLWPAFQSRAISRLLLSRMIALEHSCFPCCARGIGVFFFFWSRWRLVALAANTTYSWHMVFQDHRAIEINGAIEIHMRRPAWNSHWGTHQIFIGDNQMNLNPQYFSLFRSRQYLESSNSTVWLTNLVNSSSESWILIYAKIERTWLEHSQADWNCRYITCTQLEYAEYRR